MTKKLNIAFIKANWHAGIVDQAFAGFQKRMTELANKTQIEIFNVPGAFEMPLLAKTLGHKGDFDAIVCAALVVDGGIYRHDFVAAAVVNGLMQTQLDTGVPTYSISLTPHHFQPTAEHQKFYHDHFFKKGSEAADAVLMMAKVLL